MNPADETVPPAPRWQTFAATGVLALAALAAYHNSFRVPFLFDDGPAILQNPTLDRLWRACWPPPGDTTVNGRPVANFTLALNHALSGTAVWSYHAFNLLIHFLAALTLFGIVRRTVPFVGRGRRNPPDSGTAAFGDAALQADATLPALAIALLWLLHPLQVEAVTYVVQRVEALMGLFYLLTLYCFIRATAREGSIEANPKGTAPPVRNGPGQDFSMSPRLGGSKRPVFGWYGLSVFACLLGMATKEVMATAPVLVFLYDRTFAAGSFGAAWRRRRGYYLALAATWLPLLGLVAATGWNRSGSAGFNVGVAPGAYWQTQFEAVARYLALAFWPHPLVFDYGTFWARRATAVLPYALIVVPLGAATLVALWRRPVAGFLGAWFFAILAPTSVIPGTTQMIVEHRLYLPLAAVVAAAVAALYALLGRRAWWVCAGLALALGVLTERRNADYRDALTLWSDTAAKRPDNPAARDNLGLELSLAGRNAEAVTQYEAALRIAPDDVEANNNLGITLLGAGNAAGAIPHFAAALRVRPDLPGTQFDLAEALVRTGKTAEAIAHYEAALKLQPGFVRAQYSLADLLARTGRFNDAIPHLEAALRVNPDSAEARNRLGVLLCRTGRVADGIASIREALRLQPDFAPAHYALGTALLESGQPAAAIAEYEEVLRLQPNQPAALRMLELARHQAGEPKP